jgi:hypothetical protein
VLHKRILIKYVPFAADSIIINACDVSEIYIIKCLKLYC